MNKKQQNKYLSVKSTSSLSALYTEDMKFCNISFKVTIFVVGPKFNGFVYKIFLCNLTILEKKNERL